MKEVKMNAAQRAGEVVFVDDVERGLKCGCVCLACASDVIARKGPQLAWHFAHTVEAGRCAGPTAESVLHAAACLEIQRRLSQGEKLCSATGEVIPKGKYAGTARISDVMIGTTGVEVIVDGPLAHDKLDELVDHAWIEVLLKGQAWLVMRAWTPTLRDELWAAIVKSADASRPSLRALLMRRAQEEQRKLASLARERASVVVCEQVGRQVNAVRAVVSQTHRRITAPKPRVKAPPFKATREVFWRLLAMTPYANLDALAVAFEIPAQMHEKACRKRVERTQEGQRFGDGLGYLKSLGITPPT